MQVIDETIQADFHMVDFGNYISNIISAGDGESDLYLTFTFALNFPEIEEGTPEAEARAQQVAGAAKGATTSSINEIRTLVQTGAIKS